VSAPFKWGREGDVEGAAPSPSEAAVVEGTSRDVVGMEEVGGADAEVFGCRAGRNGDDGAVSGGVFAIG
jgi:hypothetical protein